MRLRRTATGREIADALGVPLHELGAAAATRVLSVEQLRAGADGSVLDTLAGTEPDPAGAVQEHETRRQLWQAIEQLGERDRWWSACTTWKTARSPRSVARWASPSPGSVSCTAGWSPGCAPASWRRPAEKAPGHGAGSGSSRTCGGIISSSGSR